MKEIEQDYLFSIKKADFEGFFIHKMFKMFKIK